MVVEKKRQEHSMVLKEAMDARLWEKEARELARKERSVAEAVAREAADAVRRRERESLRLITASNRAAELARASEKVWLEAQAAASSAEAELLKKRQALSILYGDEPRPVDSLLAIDKLKKRLDEKRTREASAKQGLEMATAAAAAAERKAEEAVGVAKTPRH
jgi:hypothetical protein